MFRRQLAANSWEQVLDIGSGTAWDVSIDQVNQIVWACGVSDSSKPWIAKSKDKGDSWNFLPLELDQKDSVCYQIAIHPKNPDIIYLAISESVIKTTDGGKTWHYTGLRGQMVRLYGLAIDPFNPDHLWAAGEPHENYLALWITPFILYESYDAGATWRFVPLFLPQVPDQSITAIVADPNRANMLCIATQNDGVWCYESRPPSLSNYFPLQVGNWWTFSRSFTEKIIDTVRINDSLYFQFDQFRHFPNALLRMTWDNKLIVRDNNAEQVWVDFSANIGDSWKVTTPFADWTVHLESKSDTVTVPAGTFTDCYRFWFQFHGADNDWVEWYAPGVGPVRRILYGFAVIDYPLTSAYVNGFYLPTKIDETPESNKLDQFYLFPNYPNPFNAMTVLPFDLPHSSQVSLEIYNIMGKKVRTLLADQKPVGHFEVQWDGTDELRQAVASGIYFCRLQATRPSKEVFVQTEKLILLR